MLILNDDTMDIFNKYNEEKEWHIEKIKRVNNDLSVIQTNFYNILYFQRLLPVDSPHYPNKVREFYDIISRPLIQ